MKLEIDIDDVAAKEIAKLERKIERLQEALAKEQKKNEYLNTEFDKIKDVREAILVAAQWLEPYYGE